MMTPFSRIGPLVGASAVLAGILALEISAGPFFVPEPPPDSASVQPSAASLSEAPPPPPDISTFSEIVERPLFFESRRPAAAKAEVAAAANEASPETFDLIGVVMSAERRTALLRAPSTSEVTQAVEGQSVGGWEVSDIQPTQVVLRRGDDSEVLKMNDAPPAAEEVTFPEAPETNAGSTESTEAAAATGEPQPRIQIPAIAQEGLGEDSSSPPPASGEVPVE